jgi:hypothetical protein
MCAVSVMASMSYAQTTSKTAEVRQFQVVSVDGNKVVVQGAKGAQEITVPEDFRLTVDGKPVSVHELKPGMKGSATITTTTTVTPVVVTEVRNGEIMRVVGNSIVVRGPNGIRMFSEGDASKRGVKIIRDGQPVEFTQLRVGDHLTATIVTEAPPKVMTQRQVEASLSGPPAAAAGASGAAAAPPAKGASTTETAAATPTATAGASPKRLPKTASALPFVGLLGAVSLTIGVVMSLRRRQSVE